MRLPARSRHINETASCGRVLTRMMLLSQATFGCGKTTKKLYGNEDVLRGRKIDRHPRYPWPGATAASCGAGMTGCVHGGRPYFAKIENDQL
jgi:hypothetical protein